MRSKNILFSLGANYFYLENGAQTNWNALPAFMVMTKTVVVTVMTMMMIMERINDDDRTIIALLTKYAVVVIRLLKTS